MVVFPDVSRERMQIFLSISTAVTSVNDGSLGNLPKDGKHRIGEICIAMGKDLLYFKM